MASIYDFKPRFQGLLRPLIKYLVQIKLTPNIVTLVALVGSLAIGLFILLHFSELEWLLLLPGWLFIRMALNAIDGMMAREFNLSSRLGAVLNEVGDVLSDLFLYLPLAWVRKEAALAVVLFSFAAVMTEFCGVLGKALGSSRRYDGPMGKSDRAFVVGFLSLVTGLIPGFIAWWNLIFTAASLLAILTCWNRIQRSRDELKTKPI